MGSEALSGHVRGGDDDAGFGAEGEVKQRAVTGRDFVKGLVREWAEKVKVPDEW